MMIILLFAFLVQIKFFRPFFVFLASSDAFWKPIMQNVCIILWQESCKTNTNMEKSKSASKPYQILEKCCKSDI